MILECRYFIGVFELFYLLVNGRKELSLVGRCLDRWCFLPPDAYQVDTVVDSVGGTGHAGTYLGRTKVQGNKLTLEADTEQARRLLRLSQFFTLQHLLFLQREPLRCFHDSRDDIVL